MSISGVGLHDGPTTFLTIFVRPFLVKSSLMGTEVGYNLYISSFSDQKCITLELMSDRMAPFFKFLKYGLQSSILKLLILRGEPFVIDASRSTSPRKSVFWEKATLAVSEVAPAKNARLGSFCTELIIFYSNKVDNLLPNKHVSYKSKNCYFGAFSSYCILLEPNTVY